MGLSELISNLFPTVYAEEEEQPVEVVEEVAEVVEEEEEEEEEEPEDPRDEIVEACTNQFPALKKHFDECNERVENGSDENCIEEFFHLMHKVDECVAPKIFAATQ
ncbi:ubiquinol-cytochrome C reductase hinge domain-containing protein [Gongronella butleri]|nr:ubiquinol-cytochrome C reductase hinge domain-containing protein [Gongronella butleri]